MPEIMANSQGGGEDDDDTIATSNSSKSNDVEEESECKTSACCFLPWWRANSTFFSSGLQRIAKSTHRSVEPPLCLRMETQPDQVDQSHLFGGGGDVDSDEPNRLVPRSSVVTQVDYVNFLIPNLSSILACPFYFGKIDRYEAESLLDNKPEGSFLLRDSAQDDFVFSVSFRRYNRSLHARIEESDHKFSFDCHDPGVHSSKTITGLLKHYKDPMSCMFFEPLLLYPIRRRECFSLQELARAVVCDKCSYDGVSLLPLPKSLKDFLRDYSYRHKIRSRQIVLVRDRQGCN